MASGKVYILHNAIDVDKYAYDREKRRNIRDQLALENDFVVGHVGRFVPQKNHDFLISVFKELAQKEPAARLLLIGDGPLHEHAEKRCREEGIDGRVLMLGQRSDVSELFHAMDLFVLPSVFEGIGVALVEAQANGLFCLASNHVPREADVTGNVYFLPLKRELWVEMLRSKMGAADMERDGSVLDAFWKSHYAITAEARKLQEYYENTNTHVYV